MSVQIGDRRGFLLRDPLHFSEDTLFVSQEVALLLPLLDGQHTLQEIHVEFVRQYKVLIYEKDVRQFVESLDQALMLDSERFQEHFRQLRQRFLEAPSRPAFHAGRAYAGEAEGLRQQLDSFFSAPDGPGTGSVNGQPPLQGLVAPHIDFRRGGSCYAYGYNALRGSDHDLFVVFGTSHGGTGDYYYAMTRKFYETPLGTMETAVEVVDALAARVGTVVLENEFAHRAEHSIEFQAVWLQYLFGQDRKVRVVPILCGSFQELMQAGRSPGQEPAIVEFLQALREEVSRVAERPCYVAGADLAHVGPQFGDSQPVDEQFINRMSAGDRRSLEELERGNPEGFVGAIAAEEDRYRICGISAIYSLAKVLEGQPARILKYAYWPDPFGTVSFCSAAVYAPPTPELPELETIATAYA